MLQCHFVKVPIFTKFKFFIKQAGLGKSFTYPCFMLFVRLRSSILKYLYVISKKYVTCISREHKPFCQLSQLGDFNINAIPNLFIYWKFFP